LAVGCFFAFTKLNILSFRLIKKIENHNKLHKFKRKLLICVYKIKKMSKQLWLTDIIKARGIKIKACERAIGRTNPVWKRLSLEPHKLDCEQVQGLANLLGMKPADLFQTIIHYKNIDDESPSI